MVGDTVATVIVVAVVVIAVVVIAKLYNTREFAFAHRFPSSKWSVTKWFKSVSFDVHTHTHTKYMYKFNADKI